MVSFEQQSKLFKAIMHPARLAILEILRNGEECVCHMESALGMRQAYISQHLMVLREAELVQDRREGWNIFYRVTQPAVYEVLDAAKSVLGESPKSEARLRPLHVPIPNCECPKCKKEELEGVNP